MNKNDGGPVFPVKLSDPLAGIPLIQHPGMTLRDYYRAKAMQALIVALSKHGDLGDTPAPGTIARRAEEYANAMIAERQKGDK